MDRTDTTGIQLRLTNDAPTYLALRSSGISAAPFRRHRATASTGQTSKTSSVPRPGRHVEPRRTMRPRSRRRQRRPGRLSVLGVAGHIRTSVATRRSRTSRVGSVEPVPARDPQWDFSWQRGYQFDAPIDSLPNASGDRIGGSAGLTTRSRIIPHAALTEQGLNAPADFSWANRHSRRCVSGPSPFGEALVVLRALSQRRVPGSHCASRS